MRTVSVMICLTTSMGCLGAATVAYGQSAMSLKEIIATNPQVAAIARASPKIVGGEPIEIADHPWQVALVRGAFHTSPSRSTRSWGVMIAGEGLLARAVVASSGEAGPEHGEVPAGFSTKRCSLDNRLGGN